MTDIARGHRKLRGGDGAVQERRIYWDADLYAIELERVFSRSWLLLAHGSAIANPGDSVTAYMGQDRVIVARRKNGEINAFLNTCSIAATSCAADSGNTRIKLRKHSIRSNVKSEGSRTYRLESRPAPRRACACSRGWWRRAASCARSPPWCVRASETDRGTTTSCT